MQGWARERVPNSLQEDNVMYTVLLQREILAPPKRSWLTLNPRRIALVAFVALVVLGGTWYGYDWWIIHRFVETTDDAYVGGDVTVIATKVPGFIAEVP